MRDILFRDANSAVFDADGNLFFIASYINDDLAVRRIFDGVFDQVADNFAEVVGIDIGVKNWLQRFFAAVVINLHRRIKNVVKLFFGGFLG